MGFRPAGEGISCCRLRPTLQYPQWVLHTLIKVKERMPIMLISYHRPLSVLIIAFTVSWMSAVLDCWMRRKVGVSLEF